MPVVHLRPAEPADTAAVLDVVRRAFEKYVPRIGREPMPMGVDYAVPIGRGHCRVAEIDGRIAGVLVLVPEDGYLHVETVAVDPGAQGTGVGRRLLALADQEAVSGGYAELRLYTNEAMTENLAWYARRGYRETHRTQDEGFRRVFFTRDPAAPADLSVTVADGVARLEMRRPPANHVDEALLARIAGAAAELDDDPGCRVIVLASEGKHFCAGADLGTGDFVRDRAAAAEGLYRSAIRLFEVRTPIVAAVQGSAVGGGLGLACAADFRVAEPSTRFVANFVRLGFHQGFGLSVTLPAIVGRQAAADLLLTARRVGGEEAVRLGLADRLAEPGTLRATAHALAAQIAASAPLAVRSVRATLRGDLAARVRAALDHELAEQKVLWATRDSAEGIEASLRRRTPVFTGE
ncbi:GNAT family N-acetyltransferase [Actinoplanes sp. NPDC049265]|uniref:GNAT family N-acetyltransferase n=1 Tax=Actinoplanes sp. NPDC049265 TaxID=3363902 RepID=UPI003716E84D